MQVVRFDKRYLEEMARLFANEYSEEDRKWKVETAKVYLQRNSDNFPEYSWVAINDEGECIGGIFCRVDPYYGGKLLFIDSLQVEEEYRRQGVATELLKKVVEVARKQGLDGIHMLADAREGFPKNWYEKLGFELTGWAEYEVGWDKLEM